MAQDLGPGPPGDNPEDFVDPEDPDALRAPCSDEEFVDLTTPDSRRRKIFRFSAYAAAAAAIGSKEVARRWTDRAEALRQAEERWAQIEASRGKENELPPQAFD